MRKTKRIFTFIMALTMIFCFSVSAYADSDAAIDFTRTASLDMYLYDLSEAEKDGVWDSSYVSTGVKDANGVETILGTTQVMGNDGAYGYAIKGARFTYLKVADITTYVSSENGTEETMMLYGISPSDSSNAFLAAIGLDYDDRYANADKTENDMTIYYYQSDVLVDRLRTALESNPTTVKSALESYIKENGGISMAETDEYGHTSASELPLGLYLIVETKAPEMVSATTSPFFVSLPMTSVSGDSWVYDVTLYPKNLTGMPTLEKTVRESVADTGKNQDYSHTATASAGDTVEYQILSQLPTISGEDTYLSEYTFVDTIASGISYAMGDVKLEFYTDAACTDIISTWTSSDNKFSANYSNNTMTISLNEAGLEELNSSDEVYSGESMVNSGYSNCTLRISYSTMVNSSSNLTLGDAGNSNEVELRWKRTGEDVVNTLKDCCHVYTYGICITKQFSDGKGDFSKVEMLIHNDTDNYFLTAELKDGVYYVLDHVAEEADATRFVPTEDGKILIKGLEDDEYTVTEVKTDSAYTLLRDDINIDITAAEAAACENCGEVMLTATSTIENKDSNMKEDNSSANALVNLTVINTRGFDLPQTGGRGTWMYPAAGIAAMGLICMVGFMMRKSIKDDLEDEE